MPPQNPNSGKNNTRLFTKEELDKFVLVFRTSEAQNAPLKERLKKAFANLIPTPLEIGGFVVHVLTTVDGEQARWKAHRDRENMITQPDANERYLVVEKKNGDIFAFQGIPDEAGTFHITKAQEFRHNTTANHSTPDRDDAFVGKISSDASQWNNQTIGQLVAQYQAGLVTKDPQKISLPWAVSKNNNLTSMSR